MEYLNSQPAEIGCLSPVAYLKQQSDWHFLLFQAVTQETFVVERVVTLGQNEHLLQRWARRRLPVEEGMDGEEDKE